MGRFTVFSLEDCPHCKRTKACFREYGIPYTEINLTQHPDRRNDMLSLSDRMSVPQVFLNETHVGGSEETLKLLRGWAADEDWTPRDQYENFVVMAPEPKDPRLRIAVAVAAVGGAAENNVSIEGGGGDIPGSTAFSGAGGGIISPNGSTTSPTNGGSSPPPLSRRIKNIIELPYEGTNNNEVPRMTVLEMTELLKKALPCRELKHNLTLYKNSFKASEFIDTLLGIFPQFLTTREEALDFGREVLQREHSIVNHVVDDHILKDTSNLFFRLTCHQTPNILNSYRKWISNIERADPDPMRIIQKLKRQLMAILEENTNQKTGMVNYKTAYTHKDFPAFEEAACELQGVDLGHMKPNLKLAFCINLYNLMIKYAFCKVGIGTDDSSRYSFFNNVSFRVGPHTFSFQDLENGILRGNRKAPYSLSAQFNPAKDVRLALSCKPVDCRIHFALNCGATSCPPVKDFTAEGIQEELRIVALSFCEDNVKFVDHGSSSGSSSNSKSSTTTRGSSPNNNNRGGRVRNNSPKRSDAATGPKEIVLSKIFSWYQEDFGSNQKELVRTVCTFTRGKKRVELQSMLDMGQSPKVKFAPYDWSTDASDFVPFSGGNVKANSSRFL